MTEQKTKFKAKKILLLVLAAIALIGLGVGAYRYHRHSLDTLRTQVIAEQEQAQKQKDLLERRVSDIQSKLDSAEEEKVSLAKKIDDLLTEEVYYFDAAAITEEVKEIGELATMEYRYTNVGTIDASKKLFRTSVDFPWSKKTVVMTMDGIIKVGVDVEKIKITGDDEARIITVKIPKAKLISNELNEESLQVYDEEGGLFNKVTLTDSSSLRSQIKAKAEQNARDNGVYEQAEANAKQIIRCMLESIPRLKESYKIVFE